ncbi:hypothetical protein MNEG_2515 [Monoraphidium neglectum]|uniref:cellulase n=1 Tax=Monoraphidium neglectum TaxID=145388 RepID=A0A0D2MSB6_9CHLO|nr:hypothetical protein MNEG_2515 [Monoraphidium neglectum]KIZ05445.1 hypothetical protein MNEG_2515 [Monoraphidium neglectum]|eukprot:XP_013904464.1 hypothetical protein MNEG_2515 [Monoraphidium neglectum]
MLTAAGVIVKAVVLGTGTAPSNGDGGSLFGRHIFHSLRPPPRTPPALAARPIAAAPDCGAPLKPGDQCGGTRGSACPGKRCVDGPWRDACCPDGYECTRSDAHFHSCRESGDGWGGALKTSFHRSLGEKGLIVTGPGGKGAFGKGLVGKGSIGKGLIGKGATGKGLIGKGATGKGLIGKGAIVIGKGLIGKGSIGKGIAGKGALAPRAPVPARVAPNGDPAYGDVLSLSFLFYEAQRSGKLPPSNRISWRGDSGLQDRAPDGRDVTGGWYDAGDNVKFNLPMAWTAGVLAWSVLEYKEGYVAARQYETALDNIKWATDYFIKCVGDGSTIVGQVGSGYEDHSTWTRPEDKVPPTPVFVLTPDRPGSDVTAAMAGALGAASVAFADVDPAYSARLLAAALKAYQFAVKYRGLYHDAIPEAASFYRSSNYYDDLAWAAIWLGVRTGNPSYKQAAREFYGLHWRTEHLQNPVWDSYDWDSNSWGAVLILSRWFPEDPFYKARMMTFVNDWLNTGPWIRRTPKGLGFSTTWGSLRHVGNALFLMKTYAKGAGDPALERRVDCFAHNQLAYILGGVTGRSFVVGYGPTPPQQPHHRAASCPRLGVPCSFKYLESRSPNPHIIYGALVGGPDGADAYEDVRSNFVQNEVAVDYNGGFTGILAAMVKPTFTSAECDGRY